MRVVNVIATGVFAVGAAGEATGTGPRSAKSEVCL
jgi:hypothetical protein